MPWINLTVRRGALTKEMQHAVMAKLTDPGIPALNKTDMSPPASRRTMLGKLTII